MCLVGWLVVWLVRSVGWLVVCCCVLLCVVVCCVLLCAVVVLCVLLLLCDVEMSRDLQMCVVKTVSMMKTRRDHRNSTNKPGNVKNKTEKRSAEEKKREILAPTRTDPTHFFLGLPSLFSWTAHPDRIHPDRPQTTRPPSPTHPGGTRAGARAGRKRFFL